MISSQSYCVRIRLQNSSRYRKYLSPCSTIKCLMLNLQNNNFVKKTKDKHLSFIFVFVLVLMFFLWGLHVLCGVVKFKTSKLSSKEFKNGLCLKITNFILNLGFTLFTSEWWKNWKVPFSSLSFWQYGAMLYS